MAEIKISELSIGDWVMFTPNKKIYVAEPRFTSAPAKITGAYRGREVILEIGCKREFMAIPLSCIDPIPVTPKILEKNGFVYSKVTRWYNCELKDTQRTRIGVHYGPIGADRIEISSVDAFDEDWSTIDVMINKPIKGIHQLQHALRLAGVEKEIEV